MFSAHNHDHNYFTKLTPNPLTVKEIVKTFESPEFPEKKRGCMHALAY